MARVCALGEIPAGGGGGGGVTTLECGPGSAISEIQFASYGAPYGECGALLPSGCHADVSSQLRDLCVGNRTCDTSLANLTLVGQELDGATECGDENEIPRRLYVQAQCNCGGGLADEDTGGCRCPCEDGSKMQGLAINATVTILHFSEHFRKGSEEWGQSKTWGESPGSRAEQDIDVNLVFSTTELGACSDMNACSSTNVGNDTPLTITNPSDIDREYTLEISSDVDVLRTDVLSVALETREPDTTGPGAVLFTYNFPMADLMVKIDPCGHLESGGDASEIEEVTTTAEGRFRIRLRATSSDPFICTNRAVEATDEAPTDSFIRLCIETQQSDEQQLCTEDLDVSDASCDRKLCRSAGSRHVSEDGFDPEAFGQVKGVGEAPVLVFSSTLKPVDRTDSLVQYPYITQGHVSTEMYAASRRDPAAPFGCVNYQNVAISPGASKCASVECQGIAYPLDDGRGVFRAPRYRRGLLEVHFAHHTGVPLYAINCGSGTFRTTVSATIDTVRVVLESSTPEGGHGAVYTQMIPYAADLGGSADTLSIEIENYVKRTTDSNSCNIRHYNNGDLVTLLIWKITLDGNVLYESSGGHNTPLPQLDLASFRSIPSTDVREYSIPSGYTGTFRERIDAPPDFRKCPFVDEQVSWHIRTRSSWWHLGFTY